MRKLSNVILVLFYSQILLAQGFGRVIDDGLSHTIDDIIIENEGYLRLSLGYNSGGSGPDFGWKKYALYYSELDSLGSAEKYYSWHSSECDRNREEYRLNNNRVLVTRQICNAEQGRKGMTFTYVNLNDTSIVEDYYSPYFSGSFNPIVYKDSIFVLRGMDDSIFSRREQEYTKNDTLILCIYLPENKDFIELDTVGFPVGLNSPGTLFYYPDRRQFELLYDSLQFFFTRGRAVLDSSLLNYEDFWSLGASNTSTFDGHLFTYDLNLYRHFYLLNGVQKTVRDTLGGVVALLYENRFAEIKTKIYYFPDDCVNCTGPVSSHQSDTIYNLLLLNYQDSVYSLLRYENGQESHRIRLKYWPRNFEARSIVSTENGAFYLGGHIDYQPSNGWGSSSTPFLVYINEKGQYDQIINGEMDFNVHFNSSTNYLNVFLEPSETLLYFQIFDPSAKLMAEDFFRVDEGIDLRNWAHGIYYLRLWTEGGYYLGQEAFIKL